MKYIFINLILVITVMNQEEKEHEEIYVKPALFNEIGININRTEMLSIKQETKAHGDIIPTKDDYSEVGTFLPGRVLKIHRKLGDRVRKGDKLFDLMSLEIIDLINDYMNDKAEYERSKKEYERLNKLRKEKISSEKQYLQSLSVYKKSEATYRAIDRKIHAIGFSDEDLQRYQSIGLHNNVFITVKAPIAGIVTGLHLQMGQYVSQGENVVEILNPNKLWARLHLYEKDAYRVHVGDRVLLESTIDEKRKSFGKVIARSVSFMKNKKSIELITDIEKPGKFILGSNINARIFNTSSGAYPFIVESGVLIDEGKTYVFLYEGNGRFEKKEIIIGKKVKGYYRLLRGLEETDRFASSGLFYLKALSKSEDIGGHGH